ncbi:patatin-like phospholipase domain-containing protein 4 isoform X2 [Conger conger]|uniref:patatin-like phospholipase domain-containing protein 4 isoform X2 n=1 Tax=Conger conger TaxID=82655 RepID=UPI002A5A3091|nr:patatin-like phospholipase domain-containing protein 4 isoform X2 [Conger conger]
MAVLNLSFAACGFLGIYQLGVLGAVLRHGERLLQAVQACAGASAGALVATVLVTAPDRLEQCKDFTYRFASEVRSQRLGAVTPGYDFMLTLREGIEEILPPDAHQMAGDRLHISLTNSRTRRNRMVSGFASREDLIKVLLASSFVPVYAGINAVEYQGQDAPSPCLRSADPRTSAPSTLAWQTSTSNSPTWMSFFLQTISYASIKLCFRRRWTQ